MEIDISVDMSWDLDEYIERRLVQINTDYVKENIKNRTIFSIFSEENSISSSIIGIVKDVLLVGYKLRYITKILTPDDFVKNSVLIAEMLYFDSIYENNYVELILSSQYEYSIDGIFNFKMKNIKQNWDYLCDLYREVASDIHDSLLVARYIHESVAIDNSKIYLIARDDQPCLFDITTAQIIDIPLIFDNARLNLLFSIVRTHASKLYIERNSKFFVDDEELGRVMEIIHD